MSINKLSRHGRVLGDDGGMNAKIISDHIEDCAAVREVQNGNWDTPWCGIPDKTVWMSSAGDRRGSSFAWLLLPCNDPSCSAKKIVSCDSVAKTSVLSRR